MGRTLARLGGGRLSPRGFRMLSYGAALVLGIGLVALIFAVQASSTPTFCGSCHIMKPYYESWKHSKHSKIACVECHISPGIGAEVRKKYEAVSMVVKYMTGTYGTKPWAEVDDAACLRCHERRLLEGKVQFHDVVFDHTPHLTETRRGLRLRCTSCHSQIVQGSHITVTPSTCALCHFKGQGINQGTGACLKCHQVPEKVVTATGVSFDHSQVKRLDMNCTLCHAGVVRGQGNVPKERCLTCHNQPDRLARYDQPDFLHAMHVTKHKVDCMNCHLQIEHGRTPLPSTMVADSAAGMPADHASAAGACQACHGSGHSPQRDLYRGVGGRGVPPTPSPMFAAGVNCEGCHNAALSEALQGQQAVLAAEGLGGVPTVRAGAVSCMSCHGPGYKSIYERWQQAIAARTGALRQQLDATSRGMGVSAPAAWDDARYNFLLVDRGRGIHNVNFAFALLEKSHEQMNLARAARGLPALARPWSEVAAGSSNCLLCHMGVENQKGTFAGLAFEHRRHLEAGKLDCSACHRPHEQRAPGEVVKFGEAGCMPCHHAKATIDEPTCRACHGDVRTKTVTSFRGEFSHAAHLEQGLECGNCHTNAAGDPRPPKTVCAQCHTE